jgi:hypothetical protein
VLGCKQVLKAQLLDLPRQLHAHFVQQQRLTLIGHWVLVQLDASVVVVLGRQDAVECLAEEMVKVGTSAAQEKEEDDEHTEIFVNHLC